MTELPGVTLHVDQATVRTYAEMTQDFNPLHLDPEFAARASMGSVIAHGTMSLNLVFLSLLEALGQDALVGAEIDIRFVKPVRLGETITSGGHLLEGTDATYEVWVRGPEGDQRLGGQVALGRGGAGAAAS